MLDSLMNMFAGLVAEHTISGVSHTQFGNLSVSRLPTADRFRCGEGHIVLAVLTEKQFVSLMTVLGRAESLKDPRFANWFARVEHTEALREVIESAMADGNPKIWEARFTEASVPCSTIYSIEEITSHPQVMHRGLLQHVETPLGPVKLVGPGFQLAHGQGGIKGSAATVGEHTDDVLTAAGYDAPTIADLRSRAVI